MDTNQLSDLVVSLQPHAVCRKTTSGLTMLFDRAKGVMYEMNETASTVVESLSAEPKPVEALIEDLMLVFDAPRAEIAADVRQFVEDFHTAGLLKIG